MRRRFQQLLNRASVFVLVLSGVFNTSTHRAALSAAAAGAAGVTIDQVSVGFDGYYKAGKSAAMTIVVTTDRALEGRVVTESTDPDGDKAISPMQGFTLRAPGTHRLSACFRSGRLDSDVVIRITDRDSKTLASKRLRTTSRGPFRLRPAMRQSTTLCALIGDPAGFNWATQDNSDGEENTATFRAVHIKAPGELPDRFEGYDCLDVLVIVDHFEIDPQRNTALRDWVRSGGHLLLAIGSKSAAYQESALAAWIPVPVLGEVQIGDRDLAAVESYSGKRGRITSPGRISVARLGQPDGIVPDNELVRSSKGPLIVQVPYGLGRVTVSAVDLKGPPLSKWPPIDDLCHKLVSDSRSQVGSRERQPVGRLSHSGIADLASQLHATQDSFSNVPLYSSWMVMGLMVLYIIVVGPLDYLLVHRLLKRPQLTWITMPLFVILATAVTLRAAWQTKGNQLQINQLDVVDVDAASNYLRAQTWVTIYSPETRRYSVSARLRDQVWGFRDGQEAKGEDADLGWVGWSAIPETGFGGIYRPVGLEIGRPAYSFSPGSNKVMDVPIPTWSTKSLTFRWQYKTRPLVESSLKSGPGGALTGSMVHHFPAPLEDWLIAYGNRVYRAVRQGSGTGIPASVAWTPDGPHVFQRELRGYLTRMTARTVNTDSNTVGGDILVAQAPYDPLNLDQTDLIRMLTFHDAAGGKSYTGLENYGLRRLDLSPMLDLGRAVLFAKIDNSSANLFVDEQESLPTRDAAYIRIVLPVARTISEQELRKLPKLLE